VKIALIGDSQSEALWPRVKKALTAHEFVLTRTQRGWSELNYMKEGKLAQELKDAKPELVVIELGGNNSTLNEAKYQSYIDWMLNAARQSGARHILYMGPAAATKQPFQGNKEWTRAFQSKYLPGQANLTWYDNFPHTQSGHADGVHFGGKTYNEWSAALVPVIDSAAKQATGFGLAVFSGSKAKIWGITAVLLVGIAAAGFYVKRKKHG
jgi:lysophospholipase L1-like esterase